MADGYMDFLATTCRALLSDESGLDLTADAEWRVDFAPGDWTPAALGYIIDRYVTTGNHRQWRVILNTNGVISLGLGNSSGTFRTETSLQWDVSGVPSDGERYQIRVTLDADNGAGNTVVTLYSRAATEGMDLEDDTGWVQENQDTLTGVQTWQADSAAGIAVHSNTEAGSPGANGIVGRFYRGLLWADLTKTTKVFDLDFTVDNTVGGDETVWDDAVRTGNWAIQGGANADWVPPTADETAELFATASGTISDVVDEADTTTNLHESIDDNPASPNDADWINNAIPSGPSAFFDLTDLPADFGSAESATIVVRYRGQGGSGTLNLYARLFESDESTPLSDEELVATVSGPSAFANSSAVAFSGLNTTANKATWDAARIRFRWSTT